MESQKVVFKTGKELHYYAKLMYTNCQNIVTDVMMQLTKTPPHWNFENDSFTLNESPVDCTQLLGLNEKECIIIDVEPVKYMNEMFEKYDLKLVKYDIDITKHQGKQLSKMVNMEFVLFKA